jgi:hypothetical protein
LGSQAHWQRSLPNALARHGELYCSGMRLFQEKPRVSGFTCAENQVPPFDAPKFIGRGKLRAVPMEQTINRLALKSAYWITPPFCAAQSPDRLGGILTCGRSLPRWAFQIVGRCIATDSAWFCKIGPTAFGAGHGGLENNRGGLATARRV